MAFDDLAQKLFGARRAESNAVLTDATTGTIHGTALTDSADGAVTIEIDGDVTVPEEIEVDGEVYYGGSGVGIEVPTSENVKAGDEVLVSVYGEGTMRSPAVTSAIGSGDRIAADAEAAREIAEATGQHFWDADDGAHVTEVTREEWEDSTSPNYHSGPNSLWNSLGMLFRDGLTNLLAILTNGLAIYDGLGNLASNIVASFSGDSVVLGKASDPHIDIRPTPDETTGAQAGLNFYHGGMLDISFNEQGIYWYQGYVNGVTLSLYNILDEIRTDRQGMHLYAYSDPVEAIQFARIDLLATEGAISGSGTVKLTGGNLALSNQAGTSTTSMTMEKAIAMLTTSSIDLSRSSAVSSWSGGQVRRSGKVVTVTIVGAKLASALASNANSAQITTIPVGFIPNLIQRVPCALDGAGNFPNVWAAIGTGGGIQIHNGSPTAIPTDREISLNCTYIIN